jgi:hypothetical protein
VPDLGNGNAQFAASVEFDLSVCGVECLNGGESSISDGTLFVVDRELYSVTGPDGTFFPAVRRGTSLGQLPTIQ